MTTRQQREAYLAKIPDDEPIFTLRAQDCLAAEAVERWAIRARAAGVDHDKVQEAFAIAEEMLAYPIRRLPD
jgi:hypothetical protein